MEALKMPSIPPELTDVQVQQAGGALVVGASKVNLLPRRQRIGLPNFAPVQGSAYMYGFAHGEYFRHVPSPRRIPHYGYEKS
jgi:hypothetical protein